MNLISQLNMLESSGLIRLLRAQPELEYLFRHALSQDAAYNSMLKRDRQTGLSTFVRGLQARETVTSRARRGR